MKTISKEDYDAVLFIKKIITIPHLESRKQENHSRESTSVHVRKTFKILRRPMKQKIEYGNEIKITTKDKKSYSGIFMDSHKGYLSVVAGLGIILTFPLHSILNVVKL
jgi:hypothetical protein